MRSQDELKITENSNYNINHFNNKQAKKTNNKQQMNGFERCYQIVRSALLFPYNWIAALRMPRVRVGKTYNIEDAGNFTIFRETISKHEKQTPIKEQSPIAVTVIRFRLKLIRSNPSLHWLFQRICIMTTPFWSGLKGFNIKLWMVDYNSKDYIGVYEWHGEENAKQYIEYLIPILQIFSKRDSIWEKTYPETTINQYFSKPKEKRMMKR